MKNKGLIIGIIIAVVVVAGLLMMKKPAPIKKVPAKKAAMAPAAAAAKKAPTLPAKKAISKGKGGLTVRILDSKNKEVPLRIKAFRSVDSKSGIYEAALTANRMEELLPGTYDIAIESVPSKLYKNVNVVLDKESVEDMGSISGSVTMKALNAEKKSANYPMRVMSKLSGAVVAIGVTNKPLEILSGTYDIIIDTLPKQTKKDVKVESGKDTTLDIGLSTGILLVKVRDSNKQEVRIGTRITKATTNEHIVSGVANRNLELLEGVYNVEVFSIPKQIKKDVKVVAGEIASIDVVTEQQPAPAKAADKKK